MANRTHRELEAVADRVLDAWNTQDVEAVVACYTDDLVYLDPNLDEPIRGGDAMRRYLTKLFDQWRMTWRAIEILPLGDDDGAAVRWDATLTPAGGGETVEATGLDLVILEDDRVARNEVFFDRAVLAPLLAGAN